MRHPLRLLMLALPGCGGGTMVDAESVQREEEAFAEQLTEASGGLGPAPAGDMSGGSSGSKGAQISDALGKRGKASRSATRSVSAPPEAASRERADAPATRAWFPESFLFAPQVVTDPRGAATVSVRVPDRLTTWRVLALAHDKQGGTAGAIHTFDSRLPLSVEAVVPAHLTSGDVIRLPIQVTNATREAVPARLMVDVEGATLLAAPDVVEVPASGSAVAWCTVQAEASGEARMRVRLESEKGRDAFIQVFSVQPSGRQVEQSRTGTLAAARRLDLIGPADLDPDSARARLVVHPGALAVLRSELATASGRDGLDETAYALTLGTAGAGLLETLGLVPTTTGPTGPEREAGEALTRLRSRAGQRAMRAARSPGLLVALRLAEPALATPDNEAVHRLGQRLARSLVQAQRPDGSYVLTAGRQTTQRMVVTTAAAAEVATRLAAVEGLPPAAAARMDREAALVRVRAAGVFERNAAVVTDPYSAAAMLASGSLEGDAAEAAQQRIEAALQLEADGSRVLPVPAGVVGMDGSPPSQAEATAIAAIALAERRPNLAADLGAAVLGSWRPGLGWGDGAADLRGLQAVLALFREPLPAEVAITISRDGKEIARRTLRDAALRDLSVLEVPVEDAAGLHSWTVAAEPPVPGLGFAFTLASWVPWTEASGPSGLELGLVLPQTLTVGQPTTVEVAASAPAGDALTMTMPLPPGIVPETPGFDALVSNGVLSSWRADDRGVTLIAPPLRPGQPLRVHLPLVPTIAGRFHPAPATLRTARSPDAPARSIPTPWVVRPASSDRL